MPVRAESRILLVLLAALTLGGCALFRHGPDGAPLERAAALNARSLRALEWSPFGRAETGWEIYLPLVANEVGAAPLASGVPFARALQAWQAERRLLADGVFTAETFARMKAELQERRPFVRRRAQDARTGGPCPDGPDERSLAWTTPEESWGARPNALRPRALEAWRRMRGAATHDGALDAPASLQVFSGYRSPAYDAQRCAVEGTCDGVRRAVCSAHRTGLAMDLVLDGVRPVDSTADAERLRLSRSRAYRWLVLNARRFGFVPYAFEPWHWEWTGEGP